MSILKATLLTLAMTFSFLGYAADSIGQDCPSTLESQKAMTAYLTIDVQKSLEIARFIMTSIQEVKTSQGHNTLSISGNAYVLMISKDTVEIETEYGDPTDPRTVDGVLKTTHSLCEFEAKLAEYIATLEKEQK